MYGRRKICYTRPKLRLFQFAETNCEIVVSCLTSLCLIGMGSCFNSVKFHVLQATNSALIIKDILQGETDLFLRTSNHNKQFHNALGIRIFRAAL